MPGLAKKLLVFAAIDGLFLQPVGPGKGVKIDYGTTNKVSSTAKVEEEEDSGLEIHGIVGRCFGEHDYTRSLTDTM